MNRRNVLLTVACYAGVILLALGFSVLRVRTQNRFALQSAPDTLSEYPQAERHPPAENAKPFFSLVTNRTYGTTDRARVWVNYRGVEQLDFRVYKVKDPLKFFKQLDNPHQVGEDEEAAEVAKMIKRQPTFLEKLRAFKNSVYGAIKTYVRSQLQNQSRKGFNQKFRRPDEDAVAESNRTPLNVADYARVPLLNPDQMVSSWREKLPPLEDVYDRRMISLGKREAGVYLVEAVNGDLRAYGVTIVTDLTTIQKTSRDGQMLVYAVERRTGQPRGGVRVEIVRGAESLQGGVTDKQGLLRITLDKKKAAALDAKQAEAAAGDAEAGAGEEGAEAAEESSEPVNDSYLVLASEGENFAVSDLDSFYFSGGEGEGEFAEEGEGEGGSDETLTSYIYTDRPVYRPEQKVYFKGILRRLTENGYRLLPGKTISVTVDDPNSGRLFEQELKLSSRGTFGGELDLPEEAALGTYNITAQVGETTATGYFDVQEYKKPEYKVSVGVPQRYVNAGETTKFTVSAKYFFGAPVTRAGVKYYVYRSRYYGWWRGEGEDEELADEFGEDPSAEEGEGGEGGYGYGDQLVQEGEGKLDAQGRLEIPFNVAPPDAKELYDSTYRIDVQVTDAARRTMDGSASFIGVRANTVATAQPERFVYYQNDTAKILVRAGDREGRPVQTRVKLTFVERRWEKVARKDDFGQEYPGYDMKEKELSAATVETNAQGEASYDYRVQIPGSVHIKTTVEERGKQVTSEGGSIWVADRENQWTDLSYQGEETIKLVPDKKSYRVGETAHVLALLPTDKAHLLVTTELMNVLTVRQVESVGRTVVIDVPIEARYAPNVFLNVTYVRNSDMYTQDQMLVVPARDKLLNLQIIPDKKEYKPRDPASYTILARNMDGSPAAGAEVSLGVVDESIYSIAGESVTDIRRHFYGRRYNEVTTSFSVNYTFTGYAGKKPMQLAANRRAFQLADFKNDAEFVNPKIRKIFKDTAFWQSNVVTGADGKASVKVDLPDNLTTWRATARAVTADTRVGVAVEKVLARKDVILRLAMPRFLTEGDTVTLSGIVHNYLKQDKTTKITIDVGGGARLLDPPAQTVQIPSQGEHRVNWRVAAPHTGELTILAKALTDTESDAVEMGLEVVPRGLRRVHAESVAVSENDAEQSYTFKLPANAEQYSRRLRIEVAPSIAGTLFGALDYLTGYPYGCTEQTMSQFLPTVIVAQTLKEVQSASIKDSNNIERKVRRGLRRLYGFQHEDGGWGWWKNDATDPFMSAYVVDGLTLARRAGYEVDEARLERGREKLRAMIDSGKTDEGADIDLETRAYMIYALATSGAGEARYTDDLFNKRGNLQPYGRSLLALALSTLGDAKRAQVVAAEIERTVSSDARGAHWPSNRKTHYGTTESNEVEATALSLKALARISPQSALMPQAARWLVLSRKHGNYWYSTKDTAFAIFGLTDYLKASSELSPDYSLEVYLNGEQVLAKQMTAADATSAPSIVIQRKGTEVGGASEIRIVKHGAGLLYLSTTLTHYTNEEQVAAQGSPQLRVTREYLRLRVVEDDKGTPTWKTEPLSGELRSGDTIVSRLKVEGQQASYLLIEDPIPAGCEQVAEVSGISLDYDASGWSDWYSAREFRDQKAAFFVNHFDGNAVFQYAMRVQVPGEFRIAPARVEQMYQPTVQANTAGGALTILDNK
ncbi:MAG TPA: MG2 domain-containing protein [Pyrinomonadaceae bacterium]|nr:MG2 domain-containing protein [Pyrinomonadaceae bacterium]